MNGRVVVAALVLVLVAGCADYSKLAFTVDTRLTFTQPRNREQIPLPLTLRWTMRDFTLTPPGPGPADPRHGFFAVFVDQSPIKPGQTLKAVAHGDRFCMVDPTCPNADYLAQRQVYVTSTTSMTIPRVLPLANDDAVQLHDVNIILLDISGHRIGEIVWHQAFKLRRTRSGS